MTRFDGQVALVTGAARGLGRAHALGLAARGAKVVVSDLGEGEQPAGAALGVVAEITAAGGVALANAADVADPAQAQAAVQQALAAWGRIDILVNNAGMVRDRSFANMTVADFEHVVRVHLMGTAHFTLAAWPAMRAQNYGRVVFTSSASGLYGNFGQANYGAAKAAMVGLMNVLHLEGAKYDIRVNCLVPTAATEMTKGLLPEAALAVLAPEHVTPAVLFLCGREAPSRTILNAGAGVFSVTHIQEGPGVWLGPGERTPEAIAAHWEAIAARDGLADLGSATAQTQKYVQMAMAGGG